MNELRKPKWELAVQPVEHHAFVEATSRGDQDERIIRLFEANLKG